jgi:hypothetical protein
MLASAPHSNGAEGLLKPRGASEACSPNKDSLTMAQPMLVLLLQGKDNDEM